MSRNDVKVNATMLNLVSELPPGPLQVQQVCSIFGVSRRTVENWFEDGLERVKVGRRVYTSRDAIQRFASYEQPTADERNTDKDTLAASERLKSRYGV